MYNVQDRGDGKVAIFDNDNPDQGERIITRRQWDGLLEKAEVEGEKPKTSKKSN